MDSFKIFLMCDLIFICVCVMALLAIELIDTHEEKRNINRVEKAEEENNENEEVKENEL